MIYSCVSIHTYTHTTLSFRVSNPFMFKIVADIFDFKSLIVLFCFPLVLPVVYSFLHSFFLPILD